MKKLLALLLALLMLLGLTGCGMQAVVEEIVQNEVESFIEDSGLTEDAEALLNDVLSGVEGEGELLDVIGGIIMDGSNPAEPEAPEAPTVPDEPFEEGDSEEPVVDVPVEEPVEEPAEAPVQEPEEEAPAIDEDGWYYSKEDVALYLYTYGRLPDNFITKNEARDLGWEGGSVEKYAPGCAIGGDKFGNREGILPKASGRQYYECDIDTDGRSSRGAKRIVFSNDGLIYYTDDHYENFTLLYGEE